MAEKKKRRFSWEESLGPTQLSSYSVRPLHTVDLTDEEKVLKWVEETFLNLVDADQGRIERYRCNCARYKGLYRNIEPRISSNDSDENEEPRRVNGKIVVNHFQDLIEQKVSKHAKYKPNTNVVPASTDLNDKNEAIIAEEVLFALKNSNKVDRLRSRNIRQAILGGDSWLMARWDRDKGDLVKKWESVLAEGDATEPLKDKKGKPILDVANREVLVRKQVFSGDVSIYVRSIENIRVTPDREIVIEHYFEHIDKVRRDYPHLKSQITDNQRDGYTATAINPQTLVEEKLIDHVLILEVHQKSNRYLPLGVYFKCLPGLMLEQPREALISPVPESEWGNIPGRPVTDVDLEDESRGFPSASNISPLQNVYDKIMSLIVKNVFYASHLKWFAQRGSVDKVDLTNDSTIVWYKAGAAKPEAQTFQAFGSDVFNLLGSTEEKMEKTFGVFSVSRGAPPPGTRAAQALFFYDDQEQQRGNEFQKKINELIVDVDKILLNIVADHYEDQDDRLKKILGREKLWLIEEFKADSLRNSMDIRIENSPNLPDSRYARLEYLAKVKQMAPELVSDEQFADTVEFGVYDKFASPARVAKQAAESENDKMLRDRDIDDPVEYEEQIVHWQAHMKLVQRPDFKSWPDNIRKRVIDHVRAHEMIMDNMAKGGHAALGQQLMMIPQWPVFYVPQEQSPILKAAMPPPGMMPMDPSSPPPENMPQMLPADAQGGLQV